LLQYTSFDCIPLYSVDLRKKIIETYEENNLSQRELAKRFRVALSFIQKLIKQWRETGDLNPRPHGGGQKLKLTGDQIILLGDLVQEKNDATLDELRKQLEEKTQAVVSNSKISRRTAKDDSRVRNDLCPLFTHYA